MSYCQHAPQRDWIYEWAAIRYMHASMAALGNTEEEKYIDMIIFTKAH